MEPPRRRGPDQIKEMKLQLDPGLRDALTTLCSDTNTIIVILSGSERTLLDEVHVKHILRDIYCQFNMMKVHLFL